MPDDETNERWETRELSTLHLLTSPGQYPAVWSIADIGRELDYFDPEAVVRPLCGAGLLHRLGDGFVVAAPAAYHMIQLTGHTP